MSNIKRTKKIKRPKKTEKKNIKKLKKETTLLLDELINFNLSNRARDNLRGYQSNPQEYLARLEQDEQEITNGPLLGLAISAVFTGFTAGWVVAAIGLAAGLIQWWLADSNQPQGRDAVVDPKFASRYGGDSIGGVVSYGDAVPAIFCSRSLDPTGGVTVGGNLVNSRIVTEDGGQTAYARYIISHGTIGNVDLSKTTVNEQPLSNFNPLDIQLSWQNGQSNTVPVGFENYSQNIPANNNNVCGSGLIAESARSTGGSIVVNENQFQGFASGREYMAGINGNWYRFRAIDKVLTPGNPNTYTITVNPNIPVNNNIRVHTTSTIYYQTTRRVNRIDLNFQANVYARDKNGVLKTFGCMYTLWLKQYSQANYTLIAAFYILSKNPANLYRSLSIKNLALDTYSVQILPEAPYPQGLTVPVFELTDSDVISNTTNTVNVNGTGFILEYQGKITGISAATFNGYADQNEATVNETSAQRGLTLRLQSVNEIEYPTSTTRNRDIRYNGYATVEAKVRFNEQISGNINFMFFVSEGIITHKLIATGTADAGSGGGYLQYAASLPTIGGNAFLINLDKRKTSRLDSVSATGATARDDLEFEAGTNWLITEPHSSCWWPEIYSWLMVDPRFGVSERVIGEWYCDWQNLIDSTKWVSGANEHNQSFAWHGVLNQTQELAAVNFENSKKVLLQPWRGHGKTGFYPQKTPPLSGVFNHGNASNFRLEYTVIDRDPINTMTIIYREQEQQFIGQNTLRFSPQSVTCQTHAVRRNQAIANQQSINISECTSRAQAIKTAQIMLNIARYSGRVSATLDAATIESLSLEIGHLVTIQTASTEYLDEVSGTVVETNNNGEFRLDRNMTIASGITTGTNPFGMRDGNARFDVAGVKVGDYIRNIDTGTISTVTAVTGTDLGCTEIFDPLTNYEIIGIDTTGQSIIVSNEVTVIPPRNFNRRVDARGIVWYSIASSPLTLPKVGNAVAIGRDYIHNRLYQVLSISPEISDSSDKSNIARIKTGLITSNWNPKMFEYTDIEITTRDRAINPPV